VRYNVHDYDCDYISTLLVCDAAADDGGTDNEDLCLPWYCRRSKQEKKI